MNGTKVASAFLYGWMVAFALGFFIELAKMAGYTNPDGFIAWIPGICFAFGSVHKLMEYWE